MDLAHRSIRERIPKDLQQYLETHNWAINFSGTERKHVDLPNDFFSIDSFELKAYIPPCVKTTVVFMHFPGGIEKRGTDRDQSWCSNMANGSFHYYFGFQDLRWIDTSSIFVSVDYPKLSDLGFKQFWVELQAAHEALQHKCDGIWKGKYGTSSERIVLSSSSFGAFPALELAVTTSKPFRGHMALVPLFNTAPDLGANPWGENADTVGLTPERLMRDLEKAFHKDERKHWTRNPADMPNEILKLMPRTVIVRAELDILYLSALSFENRLKVQEVEVKSLVVKSIHQVKELYNTEEGRRV